MKNTVSVSNLTLHLWRDFVRPALQMKGMLEEVLVKAERHEYTA